nr:Protein F47A4.5 [Haemonchus contortus]
MVVFPADNRSSSLRVVRGPTKSGTISLLHHVVFSVVETMHSPSYSLFRSPKIEDAVDLCRRCLECKILFKLLDRSKGVKKSIQELMACLRQYPLYRMIHIAIACDRLDLFTDSNIQYMNTEYKPFKRALASCLTHVRQRIQLRRDLPQTNVASSPFRSPKDE